LAAEFLYRNPDSAEPFYQGNMRLFICPHCSYYGNCKQGDSMPIISPLSRYMLRWFSELKTVPMYPLPGTWEDQPMWFSALLPVIGNKVNALETEQMRK
jgi:hypothetical protein